MMRQVIVVLDIGKTNIKVSALALDNAECIEIQRSPNTVVNDDVYPKADIDSIWEWFKGQLKNIAQHSDIRYITCTTHGATAVCLSGVNVILPVLDYEYEGVEELNSTYNSVRPEYQETASPLLSAGLNLGRQLFWQSQKFPEQFSSCDTILMYPQYWCWKLSGIKCSEVTSLGCHTDLWNPVKSEFSSMVTSLNWGEKFPEILKAGAPLGNILSELSEELDINSNCQILNGIHDSNASLVPYLLSVKEPFNVISTGTWVIAASVGAQPNSMSEQMDMLYNVNAFSDPVACMRFMGGREWEILRGAETSSLEDLVRVLELEVMVVPSYTNQGGPFRHHGGAVSGPIQQLSSNQHTALASLYCALMTDYCLEQLHSDGNIYIEGSFTNNSTFLKILQAFRQSQRVLKSVDSTGTTLGAAILLDQIRSNVELKFESEEALSSDNVDQLLQYKHRWRKLITAL